MLHLLLMFVVLVPVWTGLVVVVTAPGSQEATAAHSGEGSDINVSKKEHFLLEGNVKSSE